MKVSIIGAGRSRNGIGQYIGKYFHENGAKVISVLGTTEKTSIHASRVLNKYGIDAKPFVEFNEMIRIEKPDVMVIASPYPTHYEYLMKCVDLGLNIFCEKPLIWQERMDVRKAVEGIFKKAKEKRITIAMNSQWPFSIESYEKLCGKVEVKRTNQFVILLSPFSVGKEMIPDSVPHALSLLYHLFGVGELEHLKFDSREEKEMSIQFTYRFGIEECDVLIKLKFQESQPREFSFGFNGKAVVRSIDVENYGIYFNDGNQKLKIVDPLELSVRNFMEAVEKGIEPLIGYPHILSTLPLLKKIYDSYVEFEKRNAWKK
jgi:predicted dehydrogenase